MALFSKQSTTDTITGSNGDDLIYVGLGVYASGGSINGGSGTDEIRFGSTFAGDTLVIGANITNIEVVKIGHRRDVYREP